MTTMTESPCFQRIIIFEFFSSSDPRKACSGLRTWTLNPRRCSKSFTCMIGHIVMFCCLFFLNVAPTKAGLSPLSAYATTQYMVKYRGSNYFSADRPEPPLLFPRYPNYTVQCTLLDQFQRIFAAFDGWRYCKAL